MILGLPVMDGHDWTVQAITSLGRAARGALRRIILIDNASARPYNCAELNGLDLKIAGIKVSCMQFKENVGYYWPLWALAKEFPDTLIGLMHNDIVIYEEGWDLRVQAAFDADPKLALVGFCGSNELDENGGRGGGTMCYFRGEGQSQAAGRRITGLEPSIVLDSLFMMFRAAAIPHLGIEEDPPTLAHFYDKIWPCRLVEYGWRVATLGVEIDHWGSITLIENARYETDCERWCRAYNIPPPQTVGPGGMVNWGLAMYLEAERRFLTEFRQMKPLMPCWIDHEYGIHPGARPS